MVGITFSIYISIAWASRVKDTKGFYVAGESVPPLANGMATAADWMSAASFISMAGLISFMGYTGCIYLMGWTGGYVLLALLLAPYLRKFGKYTVPDFVGDRYYSNTARTVALVCAIFVSFTYVAGQMRGVGIVFSRFLEVEVNTGVMIGMAIVFPGQQVDDRCFLHYICPDGRNCRSSTCDCPFLYSAICQGRKVERRLCAYVYRPIIYNRSISGEFCPL